MRFLLVSSLSLTMVGLFLLGDWQTIVPDSCNEFSLPDSLSLGSHDDSGCLDVNCVPLNLSSYNSTDCLDHDIWLGLVNNSDTATQFTFYYYNDPLTGSSLSDASDIPCPSCAEFLSSGSASECMEYVLENGSVCTDGFRSATDNGHLLYRFAQYEMDVCISFVPDSQLGKDPSPPCTALIESVLNAVSNLSPTDILKAYHECESHSLSPDHCYWVQESIVTGKHCSDCPPLCRSTKKIMHFAQACIAVCLLAFSYAGSSIALYVLVIQNTPVRLLVSMELPDELPGGYSIFAFN